MTESDCQYFTRRAAEERAAAEQATHPVARESHLELAERYADMAIATNMPNFDIGSVPRSANYGSAQATD